MCQLIQCKQTTENEEDIEETDSRKGNITTNIEKIRDHMITTMTNNPQTWTQEEI